LFSHLRWALPLAVKRLLKKQPRKPLLVPKALQMLPWKALKTLQTPRWALQKALRMLLAVLLMQPLVLQTLLALPRVLLALPLVLLATPLLVLPTLPLVLQRMQLPVQLTLLRMLPRKQCNSATRLYCSLKGVASFLDAALFFVCGNGCD
jgi:hypothetical protein